MKFAEFIAFQAALAVETWMNLLKRLRSYWGLSSGDWFSNFQSPLAAKLLRTPRRKNILEVIYHRAKFGEAWTSPAAGAIVEFEFYRQHCAQRKATVFKLLRGLTDFTLLLLADVATHVPHQPTAVA